MSSYRYDDVEDLLLKISAMDPRVAALPFVSEEKKSTVFHNIQMDISQIYKVFQVKIVLPFI